MCEMSRWGMFDVKLKEMRFVLFTWPMRFCVKRKHKMVNLIACCKTVIFLHFPHKLKRYKKILKSKLCICIPYNES